MTAIDGPVIPDSEANYQVHFAFPLNPLAALIVTLVPALGSAFLNPEHHEVPSVTAVDPYETYGREAKRTSLFHFQL